MSVLPLAVDRKSKDKMLKELGTTEEHLQESVVLLKRWFETQHHLPELPCQNKLEFALMTLNMDIERVQDTFDLYYTIRSTMPQVYDRCNPNTPLMQLSAQSCQVILLPKLLEGKTGVIVFKVKSHTPAEIDAYQWLNSILNIYEVVMEETVFLDTIMIFDMAELSMRHVFKVTPKFISDTFYLLENLLDDRVQAFHFIHAPGIFQLVLNICKMIIKPEVYEKFKFHNSSSSLAECVPWDMLPNDYGGKADSVESLQDLWLEKLREYRHYFDKRDTLRVNESLRPASSKGIERPSFFGGIAKMFK